MVFVGAEAIRAQNHLPVGCAVRVNSRRKPLEDCASVYHFTVDKHRFDVYSLFDGHGISEPGTPHVASSFAAKTLPRTFEEHLKKLYREQQQKVVKSGIDPLSSSSLVKNAINKAYWTVEQYMEAGGPQRNRRLYEDQGTTAVMLVIVDNKFLYVSNAGDSRAILLRSNAMPARSLTLDHKPYTVIPNVANEPERLRRAGHLVSRRNDDDNPGRIALMRTMFPQTALSDDYRIMILEEGGEPRTNVSRGLGDLTEKKPRSREYYAVTPEPFITVHRIEGDYLSIILASDGLFDVFTNAEVKDVVNREIDACIQDTSARYSNKVRKCTLADRKVAQRVCEKLARTARERGSSDDITVMLIPCQ